MKCKYCGEPMGFLEGLSGKNMHAACGQKKQKEEAEERKQKIEKSYKEAENKHMWGDIAGTLELSILYACGETPHGQDLPHAMAFYIFAYQHDSRLLYGEHQQLAQTALQEIKSQAERTGKSTEAIAKQAGPIIGMVTGLFRICHEGSAPPPGAGPPPPGFERR